MKARETTERPQPVGRPGPDRSGSEFTRALRNHLRSLHHRAYREETREFLIEGGKLIGEALSSGAHLACVVVESGRQERWKSVLDQVRHAEIPVFIASTRDVSLMTDTVTSQGILASVMWQPPEAAAVLARYPDDRVLTLLWEVSDPGNAGTVIRTCEWFGQHVVFYSSNGVDATNPKVVRATMGSIFRVAAVEVPESEALFAMVRKHGFSVAATSAKGGVPVSDPRCSGKILLVCGNESHGVPDALLNRADITISIPSSGRADSLNLAVAHGILIHGLCNR